VRQSVADALAYKDVEKMTCIEGQCCEVNGEQE